MNEDGEPTLFQAFYGLCVELGACDGAGAWADLFDVLPSNARRYMAGTLRPRPERVQIWCDRLASRTGHRVSIELPPEVDEAFLVLHGEDGSVQRSIRCCLRESA